MNKITSLKTPSRKHLTAIPEDSAGNKLERPQEYYADLKYIKILMDQDMANNINLDLFLQAFRDNYGWEGLRKENFELINFDLALDPEYLQTVDDPVETPYVISGNLKNIRMMIIDTRAYNMFKVFEADAVWSLDKPIKNYEKYLEFGDYWNKKYYFGVIVDNGTPVGEEPKPA